MLLPCDSAVGSEKEYKKLYSEPLTVCYEQCFSHSNPLFKYIYKHNLTGVL